MSLFAGSIVLVALQACATKYCEEFAGYQVATLDSLRMPGWLSNDTTRAPFGLQGFAIRQITWTVYEPHYGTGENRGSAGFATWIQRNPRWHVYLRRDTSLASTSAMFDLVLDSINPYAADPHRGAVEAHLETESGGELGRFQGSIASSLAMDATIPDNQPFSFSLLLRDTNGYFIAIRDSANLKTEFVDCSPAFPVLQ